MTVEDWEIIMVRLRRDEKTKKFLQVNGIGFHPSYGTLVTIGSDGRYSMWDKVRECVE